MKKMTGILVGVALLAGVFVGSTLGPPAVAGADEATTDSTVDMDQNQLGTMDRLRDRDGVCDDGVADGVRGPLGAGVLSDLLGLEPDELRDALAEGATIADLADEAGITTDDVVAALVAEQSERLDAAVEAGRIDAEAAAERLAEFESNITDVVNGDAEFPLFPGRHGRFHHHHGPQVSDSVDDQGV